MRNYTPIKDQIHYSIYPNLKGELEIMFFQIIKVTPLSVFFKAIKGIEINGFWEPIKDEFQEWNLTKNSQSHIDCWDYRKYEGPIKLEKK